MNLNIQRFFAWGFMYFKLEPVTALAPLGSALVEPHKLDVGVFLVTDASNHSVGVHGLNDVGLVFGSLTPASGLHEEGVLQQKQGQTFRLYKKSHFAFNS